MLNVTANVVNTTATDTMGTIFVFGAIDYVVFVVMLAISAAIGIYFGFFAKGEDTTDEYLMGGKKMKTIPIAISLVASQLSGISIMTIPAEMYGFGIQYGWTVISMFFVLPILCYIIIPVFYNKNISNCYEYLELRFDKKTRQIVTISYLLTVYLILPIYIFIPALAFSQVTGINIHLINVIVCSICIFYTMLGGIKAVVWTDVVQAMVMLGSVFMVVIIGLIKVGGLGEVYNRASEGGRLTTDLKFDLTSRATAWNCFIGGVFMWTGHVGLNQSCVQRIVALRTLGNARKSLVIFAIGFFLIMGFNCFTGIIMYARYYNCDPLSAGVVSKGDKMMPFFVQDVVGHLKGMPGLFISCVFSAALSTMSANLNSLSGVVYFDYIRPYINHTEKKANLIMKSLVVISGIYCIIGGIVVEQFSSILQMVITIIGVTTGGIFGAFMLGLLVPRAHANATFISILLSMSIMVYIIAGGQYQIKTGVLRYDPLPTSLDNCNAMNITVPKDILLSFASTNHTPRPAISEDESFSLTNMSYNWYTVTGAFLVWLIGIPLSYLLPENKNKKFDPELIAPVIRSFMSYSTQKVPEEVPLKEKK